MFQEVVLSNITEEVILRGTWKYADVVLKDVVIVKSNFKAGSGDYQDCADIRDDQFGIFYGVRVGEYLNKSPFHGGDYFTLEEAKEYASKVCSGLEWL